MTDKTFIKGKDLDLETSITTMQAKLRALDINVEEASWLNPVPYVYSVHIRDTDCGLMFTNGKGSSKKSCLASALGEYFERLSCNYFFADFYLGEDFAKGEFVHYPNERWFEINDKMPTALLDEKLWDYYDPERQLTPAQLFDTNSGCGERGICALPLERQRDGKTIWFPVNIIGNLYVSNGMSAGNTANEARVQSLSEVFERYIKNKIIAEGICLPEVPQDVINRFPKIKEAIEKLQSHGYHLRVADASLGGRYPVMSVTLINPKDGSVFASFGAHPCFEVALERTVTELLQGRGLDQLDEGFQPPSFNLDEVADHHNLETHFIDSSGLIAYDFFKQQADYEFVDWNHDTATDDEFEFLKNIIHDMGFDIYIADYQHLNVYTCRILVPGMSDIYPVDDLVWSNNNEGALFRKEILSLKNLKHNEWVDILNRLEEGAYNDVQRVAEFIGIAPDAGSAWARLRIGELKAMLCLAIKDVEQAIEWVEWCLHMDQLDHEAARHYRCLLALLEIKDDNERTYEQYQHSLSLMYGEENVQTGIKIIEGHENFYGLHSPGLSLDGFNTHKKLLAGYAKLHKAKQQNWPL